VDLAGTIDRHRAGIRALQPALDDILSAPDKALYERDAHRLIDGGVPADLAAEVALIEVLKLAPAITVIAEETGVPAPAAAAAYLTIGENLRARQLSAKAAGIAAPDYYDRLAIAQALTQLADAQARLTRQALGAVPSGSRALTETWLRQQGERFDRVKRTLEEVADERSLTIARLSVVAGQLAELATL